MSEPTRRPFPTLAVVIAAIAVIGLGVGLALARGGDDDDGGDTGEAAAASFGTVSVEGSALPTLEDDADDDAVGEVAPVVNTDTVDGGQGSVGGAGDRPTLVVFLAHWCPHCQAEVPVLVDLADDGALDGVRLVAVLTGTNPEAPNYPPAAWLEREGWPGEALLDDEDASAASAYGISSYPFMVMLDQQGEVVARTAGEQEPEVVEAMVEAAGGTAGP